MLESGENNGKLGRLKSGKELDFFSGGRGVGNAEK
jgi:hypothetical protein